MSHEPTEIQQDISSAPESKRMPVSKVLLLGVLGSLALALIIAGGIGYAMVKKGSDSPLADKAARTLGMAVATVNGKEISYAAYKDDVNTLTNFYAQMGGPAPAADQLSQQVLSRQMVNVLIGELAEKFQVSVKDEDIDTAKKQLIAQFPSEEEALKELSGKYGWTMDQYVEKVIKPILLEQAVSEAFQSSTDEAYKKYELSDEVRGSHILFQVEDEKTRKEVKKLADEVLARIKKGESFEDLAKQYGSDGTKEQGGDLGWFGTGVMVKPFEDAMFALKDGELGGTLIETEFGYHIIKRTGSRRGKDFNAFMTDTIRNAEIVMHMGVPNPLALMISEKELLGGADNAQPAPEPSSDAEGTENK